MAQAGSLGARALAARIDHTLLQPEATAAEIDQAARDAMALGCAAVCVHGAWAQRVRSALDRAGKNHAVRLCAVVDFPLGCAGARAKAAQGEALARLGADELDVVALPPALLAEGAARVRDDLAPMVEAVKAKRAAIVVKAIVETAALERIAGDDAARLEALIAAACEGARGAGCEFVKTSTGFHGAGGASVRAVALLRKHAGPMAVKASGGIRALARARALLDAGADRLGCSATVEILREAAGSPD